MESSKLGAVAPRHAAPPLTLARAALRPPVASHQSRGRFAAPMHPTTNGRSCPLDTRPYSWRPTLRGLDGRQRSVPLHRQSGFRARHREQGRSFPLHPDKALSALDPNHTVRRLDMRSGAFAPRAGVAPPTPTSSGHARCTAFHDP